MQLVMKGGSAAWAEMELFRFYCTSQFKIYELCINS